MLVLPSNRDGLCLSLTSDGYTYGYAVDMHAQHTVTGRVSLSMSITGDVSLRRPPPPPAGPLREQYLLALADVMSAE